MTHEVSCAICGRKALDLGRSWNLKGWTAVTAIDDSCSLSTFRICPNHPQWTVRGPPGSQVVE